MNVSPKKLSPASSPTSSTIKRSRSLCRITGHSMEEHKYIPSNYTHFTHLERCPITHGDYNNDCNYFPVLQAKSRNSFDRLSLSKHSYLPIKNLEFLEKTSQSNSSENIALGQDLSEYYDNPSLMIRKFFKEKTWTSMEALPNELSKYSSTESLNNQSNDGFMENEKKMNKKLSVFSKVNG